MKTKAIEFLLFAVLAAASLLAARLGFSIVRSSSSGPDGAMFFIPVAIFGLPFVAGFFGMLFYSILASILGETIPKEDSEEGFFLLGHTVRSSFIAGAISVILAFTPLAS
ncbi:hypothetical protein [Rariglobus hedericola]|uniref:Uncharacterized protein n=1 Tax=Rariglobus hedericola TaxID=2597822 RepID=A0A556QER7_9BACT|nr:hypothetical protein [Rariglobus hedericola]TSJ75135.1 hypothetical protein FPL22_17205 [Rariglobus hedericola]